MYGLHFCLSFRAGFQSQYPLLEGSGVDGWMGFSFFFFFFPPFGVGDWFGFLSLWFVLFHFWQDQFSLQGLEKTEGCHPFFLEALIFIFCPEQKLFLTA